MWACAAIFSLVRLLAQTAQPPFAAIQGQIIDPSGAAVSGASVTVVSTTGVTRTSVTDTQGRYRIAALAPGSYNLRIASRGFAQFESAAIEVAAGQAITLNAQMQIQRVTENVTVSDTASQLGVDPSQSAGQLLLKGSDLDAFSDDPEDLANELQMLAGPSPGPDGGQIYIDGFTDGIMPPKASIREIRVNQNPFSAEFDRVGFGRIEILTKPGSDKYHGQASFDFANRALTARNPFLVSPIVPNYQQEFFAGNLGGPLSKKASFFVDFDRRITDENALLNYTDLDPVLNPVAVSTALVAPSHRISTNPRVDYALTPNNTLTVRYSWMDTNARNQGITTQGFDEPSRAYTQDLTQQGVQVIESAVLGARAVNEARFQFNRTRTTQTGVSSAQEVDVVGAFTGGGTFPLNYIDRNHTEFQDSLTLIRGTHTIKLGGRLRDDQLKQQSLTNFNGRYIFSAVPGVGQAIDVYQQNQLLTGQGLSQAQIASLGFGPSEFLQTTGVPVASVNVFDAGLFVQDDWRLKPNLSVNGGLRYEGQSGISDHADFAPRVGVAWAPGGRQGRAPKTVIRAGGGIFYDRFAANLLMNATLLNGANQTQYIVRDPLFYPNIPDAATLASVGARTIYQVNSGLRAPYMMQASGSIERQLPHGLSLALTYTTTRGVHELLTRDINAPLPVVFNDLGQAIGPRPFGVAAGDIYQYEGSGVLRQNEVIVSMNARVNSKLALFGYYVYNHAKSDTDGPATMTSNPYNLGGDYGRSAFDFRHRAFVSATTTLPGRIRMAPFIFVQSGLPYNVLSGVDTNNDGNPGDDRPAFAENLSRPSVISQPGIGSFDTVPGTLANAVIVPRNYLQGPGIFLLTVRMSRSWSFGKSGREGGNTGSDEIRGGESIQNGGLSGSSSRSGLAGVVGGVATAKRYALTLTASFRNLLNNVNPALPIGNLSSPSFGKSVALSTFGPLPGAGPNAGAGNRHIELQLRLTF